MNLDSRWIAFERRRHVSKGRSAEPGHACMRVVRDSSTAMLVPACHGRSVGPSIYIFQSSGDFFRVDLMGAVVAAADFETNDWWTRDNDGEQPSGLDASPYRATWSGHRDASGLGLGPRQQQAVGWTYCKAGPLICCHSAPYSKFLTKENNLSTWLNQY